MTKPQTDISHMHKTAMTDGSQAPEQLLQWYDRHHRILPWRITPVEAAKGIKPDPYRIWLSEVMLQQTTVEAVKAYFLKFTTLWPDVQALAAATEDDVLRGWAGLGYYSRARNLKKCADMIVHEFDGQFPANVAALKKLPGIGDYTSAAIAAIAFGSPATVVDGNVERVVSRLFAIKTALPQAKAEIREFAGILTPQYRAGDYAQAMMDLGSGICTPKKPACILCPLNDNCLALKEGEPELYPIKAPKKARPVRYGAAFVMLSAENQVFLRKRLDKGLLAGMSEIPGSDWVAIDDTTTPDEIAGITSSDHASLSADWIACGSITHIFTHFELRLSIYKASISEIPATNNGWWVSQDQLHKEALPTVMKKAISAALPDAFKQELKTKKSAG